MSVTDDYRHLISEMENFLFRYERLLRRYEESNETFPDGFPFPFPFPVIERKCAFAERGGDGGAPGTMELITLPGQRSAGLKEISDFTIDATSLLIIDPYLFSGPSESAEAIASDFVHCARLNTTSPKLSKLHIVHGPIVTSAVKDAITESVTSRSCKITTVQTPAFHDRVWIADDKRGLVVGTSLNGIGNRAAFLLPLPDTDLNVILAFLREENLLEQVS